MDILISKEIEMLIPKAQPRPTCLFSFNLTMELYKPKIFYGVGASTQLKRSWVVSKVDWKSCSPSLSQPTPGLGELEFRK